MKGKSPPSENKDNKSSPKVVVKAPNPSKDNSKAPTEEHKAPSTPKDTGKASQEIEDDDVDASVQIPASKPATTSTIPKFSARSTTLKAPDAVVVSAVELESSAAGSMTNRALLFALAVAGTALLF